MSGLLSKPVVPVASPNDAAATARAIAAHLADIGEITLLYVVEKGGGSMDAASVEHRERHAEEAFEEFRAHFPDDVETDIAYSTDVSAGILKAAAAHDATAIVFTSRGEGWLVSKLSGDVRGDLLRESQVPIVALPDPDRGTTA